MGSRRVSDVVLLVGERRPRHPDVVIETVAAVARNARLEDIWEITNFSNKCLQIWQFTYGFVDNKIYAAGNFSSVD